METIIYGIAKGDSERWQETVLCAPQRILTVDEIDKVKAAASADGYHGFRVTTYDGRAPNFANTLNA